MSPLTGDGEGIWIIPAIALLTSAMLIVYYRMVRY